jgi:hypothetical protein
VSRRALQFFLLGAAAFFFPVALLCGALSIGATYSLSFVDIDGDKLFTADGHVSTVALVTTADWEKARAVGDRVPDYCLGNSNYRMIIIIRFTGWRTAIGRNIASALVRHRVNQEARRLQARYDAKKIARNARSDIFVVTDFDGSASSQLGEPAGATDFRLFVFARDGKLLARWTGVPSAKQLAAVVK